MTPRVARVTRASIAAIAAVSVILFEVVPCLRVLPAEPAQRVLLVAWSIVSALVTAFGAVLIGLDGRPMTLGFGAFCIFSTGPVFIAQDHLHGLTAIESVIATAAMTIAYDLGAIGFALFALRFPDDRLVGRRARAASWLPGVAIAFVALGIVNAIRSAAGQPDLWGNAAEYVLYVAVFVVSAISIYGIFRVSSGAQRARMWWVVVGAAIGYAALLGYNAGYFFHWPVLEYGAGICEIAIPVMVGYAILRHRVLDIVIVVNRAAVYGAITFVLLCAIALVHWFVGKELEKTHLELEFELTAALLLGVGLNRLHGIVDGVMERLFFAGGSPLRRGTLVRTAAKIDRLLVGLENDPEPGAGGSARVAALRSQVAQALREIDREQAPIEQEFD